MTVHNKDIADLLTRYADLLEIEEANPFRVRAYRNAVRTITGLTRDIPLLIDKGEDLSELPAIGEDLAAKIEEIVSTGELSDLEALEKEVPGGLADLVAVPGLGPKSVRRFYKELNVTSIDDLKRAARAGKISRLSGFGEKREANILAALEQRPVPSGRTRLLEAEWVAEHLLSYLRKEKGVKKATIAGSYRRRKETVGDLDIVVAATAGSNVMDRFVKYDDVADVVSHGETRSTVRLRTGLQVDLRVVPEVSYGAALHYLTGSKAHNIACRKIAVKSGWKLNEYGLYKDKKRLAGATEQELYETLGLAYVEPELREDTGEIEAAQKQALPALVTLKDMRGDLHVHTTATDGRSSLEDMAEAAKKRGYDYLAIADHSKHLTNANGLDEKRLAAQIEEIDRLNEKGQGLRILKSIEVDILTDGKLDLPDSVLKRLDLTVGAIHYDFRLSEQQQTRRILRAMDNPYFNILAHPTGRAIGFRPPYALDMDKVMREALDKGCYLEVNAQPERMDLDDHHCRRAKELGLKLAISTDAHGTDNLDLMRFGLSQARRGWLEPDDILNTRTWPALKKLLKR